MIGCESDDDAGSELCSDSKFIFWLGVMVGIIATFLILYLNGVFR